MAGGRRRGPQGPVAPGTWLSGAAARQRLVEAEPQGGAEHGRWRGPALCLRPWGLRLAFPSCPREPRSPFPCQEEPGEVHQHGSCQGPPLPAPSDITPSQRSCPP